MSRGSLAGLAAVVATLIVPVAARADHIPVIAPGPQESPAAAAVRTAPAPGDAATRIARSAATGTLRAGAGRADITPPTGYYFQGWVRSDARGNGVLTRLYARVIVLQRGSQKVALVAEDLNGIAGGMLADAANLVKDRGFSERNVIDSASHTHGGPGSYYNFGTYNSVFPTKNSLTAVKLDADPQLYTFLVKRLALAIRRADADLAPASAGWGSTQILGLTHNRSLEAHLADHGILKDYGQGRESDDPDGYAHTIDPAVDVLRVDKIIGGRHVPIGIWSAFANHGTTIRATFPYYARDHHGSATLVPEQALRAVATRALRRLHRRRSQEVVTVYGNTDEGDMSAGLSREGPAWADEVGRIEAKAFLTAWRSAGRRMSTRPALDTRWTRVCFCGQETEGGKVASQPEIGVPLLTGSEEGRGGLEELSRRNFEGTRNPVDTGAQGHKLGATLDSSSTPRAVPLLAVRVADRMLVSVPGEMTSDMGRRVRASVLGASAPGGISRVVISGLVNEYLSYFTTPEEYERQHYEGGSTLFGKLSSNVLKLELTELARRLVEGRPAPEAYPYDPGNGLEADKPAFGEGAATATAKAQPTATRRLGHAVFSWQGGPKGLDRPLDTAFIRLERRHKHRWVLAASDLGLQVLWGVDGDGVYTAQWEIPLNARLGAYRFVVRGNRYRLVSRSFSVLASRALTVVQDGTRAVRLEYPRAVVEKDVTYRPERAAGGAVRFSAGARSATARRRHAPHWSVPGRLHGTVIVRPGAARDRFGNTNGDAFTLR